MLMDPKHQAVGLKDPLLHTKELYWFGPHLTACIKCDCKKKYIGFTLFKNKM